MQKPGRNMGTEGGKDGKAEKEKRKRGESENRLQWPRKLGGALP
jgi:hypothetical protein